MKCVSKKAFAFISGGLISMFLFSPGYTASGRPPAGEVAPGHEAPYTKPADLSVEKTTESSTIYRGSEVDFVIKVKNEDRENPAVDVTVSDTLTSDYDFADVRCPEGWTPSISGRYISCAAPRMAPGEMATMFLKVKVVGPCSDEKTYNRAVVTSLRDPNSVNNMSTVELYIRCPEESTPTSEGHPSDSGMGDETSRSLEGRPSVYPTTCYEEVPPVIIGKTPDMNIADRRVCCERRFTVSPADTGVNYNAVECCLQGYERPDALSCCTSASRATAVGNASALSRCSR